MVQDVPMPVEAVSMGPPVISLTVYVDGAVHRDGC